MVVGMCKVRVRVVGHACSFTHTQTSLQTGTTEGMERESEREGLGLEVIP